MSQRLSRRQIKRDEFKESLGSAIHFIRDHLRLFVGALVAVLVVALAAAAVVSFLERRSGRANESLARAVAVYGAQIDVPDPNPNDPVAPSFADRETRDERAAELLEAVREDFRGSDAADVAAVYLGQLAASSGDAAAARSLWEEFLDRQGEHMLAAQVRLNLMRLDRAEGRAGEVAARLQAMLDRGDEDLPADLALYELMLTHQAMGESDKAQEARRRLVEEHPQSPLAVRLGASGAPSPAEL